MSFRDQVATDLANVFFNTDEFAESVVYCPETGVEIDAKAIVDIGDALDPDAFGGAPASVARIHIFGLTDEPRPNDIVRCASQNWRIVNSLSSSDGVWVVAAVKDERA